MKKRRMDLELLQREVAEQLGVDKFTVLNLERGKTSPDVRYYPTIIAFLGHNPLPQGETFPERLKAARQARGLSWKRLAEELGVWASTVRDWENGTHRPTPAHQRRVMAILNIWPSLHKIGPAGALTTGSPASHASARTSSCRRPRLICPI